MRRTLALWLALGFIILGVCGYLISRDLVDVKAHNAFLQLLRDAAQSDRDLNEAVLRLRLGLLSNYDLLVAENGELRNAHAALKNPPAFILPTGRISLGKFLQEAEENRLRKAALIEDFKTQFAVLKNSLAYFPILVGEVLPRAWGRADGAELVPVLNRLLQNALIYNLTTSGEDEMRFTTELDAARERLAGTTEAEERADLALVVAHASVILTRKPLVDSALREITALPTTRTYDGMQTAYERNYGAALSVAEQRRLLIYLTGLLTLLASFALVVRQFQKVTTALRAAEVKYRRIFEQAGQGIFQTTPDGRYLSANPALARFYGYSSSAELIRGVGDVGTEIYVDPKRREQFRALVVEHGEVVDFESQIRRKDGSLAWIIENSHVVRDAGGAVLYYEGIVDDITERKRTQYQRERSSQRELFHHRCLLGLAQLDKTDFDHAVREILDTTSYALGVDRVSAWRLRGAGTPEEAITLIDLFDFAKKQHITTELTLSASSFPRYFAALSKDPTIVANDARTDPRTSEFLESYLQPLGISSMLDVSVWAKGQLAGVICLERTGPQRDWETDEVDFATGLGPLLAVCFETAERVRAEREAAHERERAEQLLLNILPSTIARRLQQGEGLIADHFAEATVLFADIVDFTELSAGIPPQSVVALLNEIFSSFDQLAEKHGLEKIKTIGDAYMAVGGLPELRPGHTRAVVEMALEMLAVCETYNRTAATPIYMRIGVHTGPVVAGVIGIRKFIYDLWGDTVNLASRMESHGVKGGIQVTQAVHEKLAGEYAFEERGEIPIKGRGYLPVFLLKGRRNGMASA